MDDDTQIASNFTVGAYKGIRPSLDPSNPASAEWKRILQVLGLRIRERFFRPIGELTRFDRDAIAKKSELPFRPGAAIMALDCLLIDTLQHFGKGVYRGSPLNQQNHSNLF